MGHWGWGGDFAPPTKPRASAGDSFDTCNGLGWSGVEDASYNAQDRPLQQRINHAKYPECPGWDPVACYTYRGCLASSRLPECYPYSFPFLSLWMWEWWKVYISTQQWGRLQMLLWDRLHANESMDLKHLLFSWFFSPRLIYLLKALVNIFLGFVFFFFALWIISI